MKLISPNGESTTIFSRERGHADGVQTFTYSSSTVSGLARLAGNDISGTWTLNIRDAYGGSDTGTLQSWTLNFDATPTVKTTDGSNNNGNETTNEDYLEQFFNLIFGDIKCNSTRDDCVPKVGGTYISNLSQNSKNTQNSDKYLIPNSSVLA